MTRRLAAILARERELTRAQRAAIAKADGIMRRSERVMAEATARLARPAQRDRALAELVDRMAPMAARDPSLLPALHKLARALRAARANGAS